MAAQYTNMTLEDYQGTHFRLVLSRHPCRMAVKP
ncbi:DUF905 family protein [Photorhabdus sp. RM71S]